MIPRRIWRDVRIADLFTIANAFTGLLAVGVAMHGAYAWAAVLVLAGILLDGVDGAVARLGGGGGPLGATLDTLADVVTFVAAPALVVAAAVREPIVTVAAALYVVAGMLRLARFMESDTPYFWGLSTPGGAIIVAGAILVNAQPVAVAVLTGMAAIAMIIRLPLPKLRGAIGITGVVFILIAIGAQWLPDPWKVGAVYAMLVALIVYMVLGPGYVAKRWPQQA